jgi:hypothetical protein
MAHILGSMKPVRATTGRIQLHPQVDACDVSPEIRVDADGLVEHRRAVGIDQRQLDRSVARDVAGPVVGQRPEQAMIRQVPVVQVQLDDPVLAHRPTVSPHRRSPDHAGGSPQATQSTRTWPQVSHWYTKLA